MRKFNLSGSPKAVRGDSGGLLAMAEPDKPVLTIMDNIGEDIFGGGVGAVDVMDFLARHADEEVSVRINSFGGDVYDGLTIYNLLLSHGNAVGIVEGIAFSAAAILAMGCKELHMKKQSDFGIHKSWTVAIGNSDQLKSAIEWLDLVDSHQVEIFSEKTGADESRILEFLHGTDDGTVWSASEAFELGFCDKVIDDRQPKPESSQRTEVVNSAASRIYQQRQRALARRLRR